MTQVKLATNFKYHFSSVNKLMQPCVQNNFVCEYEKYFLQLAPPVHSPHLLHSLWLSLICIKGWD